jgi:cob(I)alamin adenosyltransferase
MSKIYTKQGDKGATKLGNGAQLPKDHVLIDALGTVDELNAAIGYAVAQHKVDKRFLEVVQGQLLALGAELCLSKSRYESINQDIEAIEKQIDTLTNDLPPLTNFVLPGGSAAAAWIHFCRAVCRRAERYVVASLSAGAISNPLLVTYLNRLSDFFFVLARHELFAYGGKETIWKP